MDNVWSISLPRLQRAPNPFPPSPPPLRRCTYTPLCTLFVCRSPCPQVVPKVKKIDLYSTLVHPNGTEQTGAFFEVGVIVHSLADMRPVLFLRAASDPLFSLLLTRCSHYC